MLPAFMHLPLSTGYVLVGLFSCPARSAPDITLQFQNDPPRISHTRSSASLTKLKKVSSSPSYEEFPILEGVTSSQIQLKYDVSFTDREELRSHQSCVAISSARITITYKPVVYINSNIPKGSCRYKETLKHEMKHVATDIDTINEFLPDIRDAAANALRHTQTTEPIDTDRADDLHDDISEKLSEAVNEENAELQKTRKKRQRQIDSREEYERLSKACPKRRS